MNTIEIIALIYALFEPIAGVISNANLYRQHAYRLRRGENVALYLGTRQIIRMIMMSLFIVALSILEHPVLVILYIVSMLVAIVIWIKEGGKLMVSAKPINLAIAGNIIILVYLIWVHLMGGGF